MLIVHQKIWNNYYNINLLNKALNYYSFVNQKLKMLKTKTLYTQCYDQAILFIL